MKALILSAGFGTRLMPYTMQVPKPLFPVGEKPMLGRIIDQLIAAGAEGIAVNTHHLGQMVSDYLATRNDPVPVVCRHEPEILGTGGAIGNFSDFLADAPFLVINSDVFTDIDLGAVYAHHLGHDHPVTLVVHDLSRFNTVSVDADGRVTGFSGRQADTSRLLAFTGIQVIDPEIHARIPENQKVSSIDVYRAMIDAGKTLVAYEVNGHYWNDLGTPARYRAAVIDHLAPGAFEAAFGQPPASDVQTELLAGDGSDRLWYRIKADGRAIILADHGITIGEQTAEIDAFVAIGGHLLSKGVPVPEIYTHNRFSGLVFLEDLGDHLLQQAVAGADVRQVIDCYRPVIDVLCHMAAAGADGFDPAWAYQGAAYDKALIIEKECRYFTAAFINGYLKYSDVSDADLMAAFEHLADQILANAVNGLIHRDMQSRNIMVKDGRCFFIDFQGARFGPVQYDLAALLADPYVNLSQAVRGELLRDAAAILETRLTFDAERFFTGFQYCTIARLMQALGAYGYLSRMKQKPQFAAYIPAALHQLDHQLQYTADPRLQKLTAIVSRAAAGIDAEPAAGP